MIFEFSDGFLVPVSFVARLRNSYAIITARVGRHQQLADDSRKYMTNHETFVSICRIPSSVYLISDCEAVMKKKYFGLYQTELPLRSPRLNEMELRSI